MYHSNPAVAVTETVTKYRQLCLLNNYSSTPKRVDRPTYLLLGRRLLTSAMMSSVTAGTRGIPRYTIRLCSSNDGRSGGGPTLAPSRSEFLSSATPPAPPIICNDGMEWDGMGRAGTGRRRWWHAASSSVSGTVSNLSTRKPVDLSYKAWCIPIIVCM